MLHFVPWFIFFIKHVVTPSSKEVWLVAIMLEYNEEYKLNHYLGKSHLFISFCPSFWEKLRLTGRVLKWWPIEICLEQINNKVDPHIIRRNIQQSTALLFGVKTLLTPELMSREYFPSVEKPLCWRTFCINIPIMWSQNTPPVLPLYNVEWGI